MPRELPKSYDPAAIEDRWAEYWVKERIFEAPAAQPVASSHAFTMILPPPNVTGRLHMGHMLNQTEMDILARWHRMRGDTTLWVPGTDHAGIATQMMVERQLTKEGKTRQELGREAFVERVWEWKTQYGGAILDQMKRLGASVDWSRTFFTMDEPLSAAVREAFVRLYEEGLIYRGAYIVNWCPRCQTAISDLEVVHEEQPGKLYEIRYPLADGTENIVVATTRPETLLGDMAVAVNPGDRRYTHMVGKLVRLPLSDREIPVIADEWADPQFGTGAVKVTPAHDTNDFAVGERHHLQPISVIDETGHMNAAAGAAYAGLDRYEAREKILADLQAQGLLVRVKEHVHSIGKCDRCKTVVEPRLSMQWFIRIQPLADKAIEAVEAGAIRFTPEQYKKTYFEWMRNIHDWCISRQLWWGHRIPAWQCEECGGITVARETPASCSKCGGARIEQESDVLDTWFSSGLLPFTVFGWPQATPDLAAFYPLKVLVTGFDILFFWVARMIMLGCHFTLGTPMPDGSPRTLENSVPFREVYIHALVRDADRQKMSKTKGNVIDPIDVIERYGTDAVRFTLASMASPGTDIAFSEARTEGYRAFANKIWNATRFIFMQMLRAREAGIDVDARKFSLPEHLPTEATLEDRWIVSRLNAAAGSIHHELGEYRFDNAANGMYQFFWGDFCDWYLEILKERLRFTPSEKQGQAIERLVGIFETALRLLSPFMPFLTEEIWQALYDGHPPAKSIALTRYPAFAEGLADRAAEERMRVLQETIVAVRARRKDLQVEERARVPLKVARSSVLGMTDAASIVDENKFVIARLAGLSGIEIVSPEDRSDGGRYERLAWSPAGPTEIFIDYEKPVDPAAERERLQKDLTRLEAEINSKQRQLQNESFLAKAPAKVVEGMRTRAGELAVLIEKTQAALDALDGVRSR
jgi:valyl-tRNA synthetase